MKMTNNLPQVGTSWGRRLDSTSQVKIGVRTIMIQIDQSEHNCPCGQYLIDYNENKRGLPIYIF
jgi:hypothetical protein